MDKSNQALMAVSILVDYLKDVPGSVFDAQKLSEMIVSRANRTKIGFQIRLIRSDQGMDRPTLGELAGINAEVVMRIERGQIVVEPSIYDRLLKPFGLTYEELHATLARQV